MDKKEVVNGSGVQPVEYKVLLLSDHIERTTSGGIILPSQAREKEQKERVVATLVAVGGRAFMDPEWGDPTPEVGKRVRVAKYAGYFFTGADDRVYQLCQDKDIAGIVIEDAPEEMSATDQPDFAGDGKYTGLRSE